MARYTNIDSEGRYYIESANGKLENNVRGHTYGEAIDKFAELENADVAPKSEVEELKVRLEINERAYKALENLYNADIEALVEARRKTEAEVAREIFEEIEKIRLKEIHKCETLRALEGEVSQRKYWEGGYNSLRQLSYWIAELKKKYTEERE